MAEHSWGPAAEAFATLQDEVLAWYGVDATDPAVNRQEAG